MSKRKIEVAFDEKTRAKVLADLDEDQFSRVTLESITTRGVTDALITALAEHLPQGAWVAGGCFESLIRGAEPKDYDLFFRDQGAFEDTLEFLTDSGPDVEDDRREASGYKITTPADRDAVYEKKCRFVELTRPGKPKIQLIKTMWYPSLEAVLHSFDFTAAQVGLDNGEIVLNPLAALDIARKRLVLHRMTFPASTLRRMIKYTQKGYYVCPGSIQQIATATAEVLEERPEAVGPVYID